MAIQLSDATRALVVQASARVTAGEPIEDVARDFGWSVGTFRTYRSAAGLSERRWLTREQIIAAHERSRTEHYGAVAADLGVTVRALCMAFTRHGLPHLPQNELSRRIREVRLRAPLDVRRALMDHARKSRDLEALRERARIHCASISDEKRRANLVKARAAKFGRTSDHGPDRFALKWERRVSELERVGLSRDAAEERATAEMARRLA